MKTLAIALVATVALAAASAASAQTAPAGSDYSGQLPWQPRDANERLVRLQAANSVVANRYRDRPGMGVGGSGYGAGGSLGSAQGFANYFSVTNNVSCSGEGGAIVTCTGGTNTVTGSTQTTTDSTISAKNEITGNTITNTQNGSNTVTGDVLNGPN
jgi:hypothetical protein